MTEISEIQRAILSLPESDYTKLREWLAEIDWERWDREIEADSKAGRLDFLAAEADEAKKSGTLRDL
jgi:hypothetical protein